MSGSKVGTTLNNASNKHCSPQEGSTQKIELESSMNVEDIIRSTHFKVQSTIRDSLVGTNADIPFLLKLNKQLLLSDYAVQRHVNNCNLSRNKQTNQSTIIE